MMQQAIDIHLWAFYFWYGVQIFAGGILFYIGQLAFESYVLKTNIFLEMAGTVIFVIIGTTLFHLIQVISSKTVGLQTGNLIQIARRLVRR